MSVSSLSGATVLITGGTGTFGNAFLKKCLDSDAAEIRIFSRDEKKQYDMAQIYRGNPRVKFYLGDVRNKKSLEKCVEGCDIVFHAAAMKQVPSCECFPEEAVLTNITGSENVIDASIEAKVKKIVCLSTDKAVYPTSTMGMTKSLMEKIALSRTGNTNTEICITRFGNLIASRGSAIPLFIEQVKNGLPITITDPAMTRFIMTVTDAVDLVETAFTIGHDGQILVKNAKSCSTGDLATAVAKYLKLESGYPINIIGERPGEKMHEQLLTQEEAWKACEKNGYIVYDGISRYPAIKPELYKSDSAYRYSVDELVSLIHKVYEEEDET